MVKYCHWGKCTNSDKKGSDVIFHRIPRPCKYYHAERKDSSLLIKHNVNDCDKCKISLIWINSCKIEGFKDISCLLNRTYYICSKHFIDGKPSQENPNPISAGSTMATNIKSRKRKRNEEENIFENPSKIPLSEAPISPEECKSCEISKTASTSASDLVQTREISCQTIALKNQVSGNICSSKI